MGHPIRMLHHPAVESNSFYQSLISVADTDILNVMTTDTSHGRIS